MNMRPTKKEEVALALLLLLVRSCTGTICRPNQVHKFKKCQMGNNENSTKLTINRNYSNQNCVAFADRNESDCRSLIFPERNDYAGKKHFLKISSYCYQDEWYVLPAFNITIDGSFKSRWKAITLRYWVESYNLTVCVQSNVSNAENSKNSEFFHDNPLYDPGLIYKNVELEYAIELDNSIISGKYIFLTPGISYKKEQAKYESLLYINLRDTSHIELNIEKCDSSLNISQYIVSMCACSDNYMNNCMEVHSIHTDMSKEHIVLYEDLQDYYGCYFYLVQAVSEMCENNLCFVSKSPSLNIGRSYKYLYWLVNICFIVIAGVVILISGFMKLKHCREMAKKQATCPTVLLLYEPIHARHVETVICLAEFLELHFQMSIILDVDKHDPLDWLITTMSNVDNIVLVSSPKCQDNQESIYRGLYSLALHNLTELISSKKCGAKISVLVLPYCCDTFIPLEVKFSRQFKIPKELSKFVSHVHDHSFPLCNYYKQLASRQLEKYGSKLKQCIKEMDNVLQDNAGRLCENNERRSLTSLLDEISVKDISVSMNDVNTEVNEEMSAEHDSEQLDILQLNLLGETSDVRTNHHSIRSRDFRTTNKSNTFYLHNLKL